MKTAKSTPAKNLRVRPTPSHRNFKLSKARLKQSKSLPTPIQLLCQTAGLIKQNPRPFGVIILISLILSLLFVQGLGTSFEISQVKQNIEDLFGGTSGKISTAFALFGYLLGSAGSAPSQLSGVYQMFLVLIISLATIWLVRQLLADERPKAKDAFYKGMYPLIPFVIVIFVIGLQLLPLLLGNMLFGTVIGNGLAVTAPEKILWGLLFAGLALLSFYMITSSLFAAYIVTLADMTPLQALRSARGLVLHRRLGIWLRIIILPLVMIIVSAVILMPLLIIAPPIIAQMLFLVIAAGSLVIFHTYMYLLYRALL
jgi:hypothetical protein